MTISWFHKAVLVAFALMAVFGLVLPVQMLLE